MNTPFSANLGARYVTFSSAGEESSEEDEVTKLQLGVGEGWALKGVSSSCITNEWYQESDVISVPLARGSPSAPVTPSSSPSLPPVSTPRHVDDDDGDDDATSHVEERTRDDLGQQPTSTSFGQDEEEEMAAADFEFARKPQPSVSWASWLLSFLLNHPHLRRLAMRKSLFRTLVAYLRSPGAPHRLRIVPLLTHLVRSHAEFVESPPPLEELSGLLAAVLRECDKLTCGRGPRSSAWRSSDCPGGLQLDTSWANAGLLLLTDLAMATRRAQDIIRHRPAGLAPIKTQQDSQDGYGYTVSDQADSKDDDEQVGDDDVSAAAVPVSESQDGKVRISLPPFGTRLEEGLVEEGCPEVAEEAEDEDRNLVDRVLVGLRSNASMTLSLSLGAEDRELLEADLRSSVLPDLEGMSPHAAEAASSAPDNQPGSETEPETPSRCLHHLLEILDTLRALRDGWPWPWPSPEESTATASRGTSPAPASTSNGSLYLDSILCEAWMDAVGPAAVVESDHPFQKGAYSQTLCFPGADGLVVFLDPRSSIQEVRYVSIAPAQTYSAAVLLSHSCRTM